MKLFRHTVNVILSTLLVAIGFGACGTSKSVLSEANHRIDSLEQDNYHLRKENDSLRKKIKEMNNIIKEMNRKIEDPRKVVYGPPPSSYNRNIRK